MTDKIKEKKLHIFPLPQNPKIGDTFEIKSEDEWVVSPEIDKEKTITTFETTITWYRPRDIAIPLEKKIFVKTHGEDNLWVIMAGTESDLTKVEWWAELPNFGDEK